MQDLRREETAIEREREIEREELEEGTVERENIKGEENHERKKKTTTRTRRTRKEAHKAMVLSPN